MSTLHPFVSILRWIYFRVCLEPEALAIPDRQKRSVIIVLNVLRKGELLSRGAGDDRPLPGRGVSPIGADLRPGRGQAPPLPYTGVGAASWYGRGKGGGVGWGGPLRLPWSFSPRLWGCPRLFLASRVRGTMKAVAAGDMN